MGVEELYGMNGLSLGAIMDLVAATGSECENDVLGRGLADVGE